MNIKVPIIMCNWKRTDNIPRTLAMLEGQTTHNFNLYIWNNNVDDKEKLDKIISMYKLSYNINVHHSSENVGGIGRFYYARDIKHLHGSDPIIFIDDDVQFGEDMVETFLQEHDELTIHSFYSHKISDTYWGKTRINEPHKDADYCGTGGMVAPIGIFQLRQFYELFPLRFHFVEDLWLSYFFKYHLKGKLKRSNNDFILESDQFDQGLPDSPLRPIKEELLEFCKDKWIRKDNIEFNNIFDKTYVINMANRQDRMQRSDIRLKDLGIKYERFEAVNGHNEERHYKLLPGEVGCYKSHFNILTNAKQNKYNSILILEDDVVFVDDMVEKFFKGYECIPKDWDMIYLGCNHKKPYTRINNLIVKCNFAYTTSAMVIRNTAFDKIINECKNMDKQIDVKLAEMQASGTINAYAFHPWLMYQEDGWSDIQGRHVNYGVMRR